MGAYHGDGSRASGSGEWECHEKADGLLRSRSQRSRDRLVVVEQHSSRQDTPEYVRYGSVCGKLQDLC